MSSAALRSEDAPTGGSIARLRHATEPFEISSSAVILSSPSSVAAETIRALRTHIQSQHLQEGRRGLAVCGPHRDAGCTFVAVNLAIALSTIGVQTLLIDANMREPGLAAMIKHGDPKEGLREALSDQGSNANDFIHDNVLPYLSILYAGTAAPNAQELLATDRFAQVMNGCLRDYDATIIDTPPANTCADARRVSNVVGYSLVVTRKHRSLVADVKTLVSELEDDRATVVGTVLNEP
jgi:protein-tyrosine kinase